MLNYGEPQVLELLKNTLPSRLYPMLFPIDNLSDAVTAAKWVLIKEKIDGQKTGQSSTTPFMKVNDCNQSYEKSGKKSVTFDALETLERQCDSIDRLTSLVSKINVKVDKKETPTNLKSIETDKKAKVGVHNPIFTLKTDLLVETRIEMKGTIITKTGIVDQTIEISLEIITEGMTEDPHIGLVTGMVITDPIIGIEATTDKTIELDKIIEIMTLDRDIEIGVKVEIGLETIVMTEIEAETEVGIEMDRHKIGPEPCQMTEENQDPGPTLE